MLLQTIQPADAERLKQPVRPPAMSSKFFTLALHVALPVAIDATIDARLVDSQGGLSSVGLLQVSTDAGGFGSVCGANEATLMPLGLRNLLHNLASQLPSVTCPSHSDS